VTASGILRDGNVATGGEDPVHPGSRPGRASLAKSSGSIPQEDPLHAGVSDPNEVDQEKLAA